MTSYDMDAVLKFTQPLPRQGVVDDVADAAVFLASERSAQITGIVLPVDGGTTAGPPANQLKLMLGASRERSEEHTSELQSLMRISYAVFCLKKKIQNTTTIR